MNEFEIINNVAVGQFEADLGDQVAFAAYNLNDKTITFTHTIVPAEYKGQGVGAKLVTTALDYAQDNELRVIPICPFVSAYIRGNPEYQPLLSGSIPPDENL